MLSLGCFYISLALVKCSTISKVVLFLNSKALEIIT